MEIVWICLKYTYGYVGLEEMVQGWRKNGTEPGGGYLRAGTVSHSPAPTTKF